MAIEDRLARGNADDIIHIGGVMEGFLDTEAGKLVQALLRGRQSKESKARTGAETPAERRLGRIEMCETLLDDLEQFIVDRNKLLLDIKKERPSKEMHDGPPVDPVQL